MIFNLKFQIKDQKPKIRHKYFIIPGYSYLTDKRHHAIKFSL